MSALLTLFGDEITVGPLPYSPIIDLRMSALSDSSVVPGAGVSSPSKNMVAESSGKIVGRISAGSTETGRYANGPDGASLTAKRLQLAVSGAYDLFRDVVLPAGPFTVKFAACSNTGAGTEDFRYGVLSGGGGSMTVDTTAEGTWETYTFTVTPNGTTDAPRVSIAQTGATPIDILIDQVQWYAAGDTIPAYADEAINQPILKHELAYRGSLVRDGNMLDARTTLVRGFIPFSTYPQTQALTEVTLMALVSATDDTISGSKVLSFDGTEGTLTLGTQLGRIYAAPVLSRITTNPAHYIKDTGFHVLTLRVKAGEQALWIDKFKHTVATVASPTIPTKEGLLLGNDDSFTGDRAFRGKYSNVKVFDKWLSDAEVVSAYGVLVAQHRIAGGVAPATHTIWIAEGDSITVCAEAAPDGPGFQAQYAVTSPTDVVCMNNAVSGSNLTHLTTRLTSTSLTDRIAVAVANGYNVIVTVLIGANGIPTIAALETYWNALKTAGAKVVACTILPREDAGDAGAAFNASRATLNAQIKSSSVPNAVADLAANADIGADGAASAGVYFRADKIHMNAAGHTIALGIIQPVLESLGA